MCIYIYMMQVVGQALAEMHLQETPWNVGIKSETKTRNQRFLTTTNPCVTMGNHYY